MATTSNIYQEISEKLKLAPKSVLERVLGYVDGLMNESTDRNFHRENLNYQLSEKQKKELDEMENLSDDNFISSEEFQKSIKEKYGF